MRSPSGMSAAAAVAAAVAAADDLVSAGRLLDAIDLLTSANRQARDAVVERRLRALRWSAFDSLAGRDGDDGAWPVDDVEVPVVDGLATIEPDALSPSAVRSAIVGYGHARVPALIPPDRVTQLVRDIDRAFDAFDAHAGGAPADQTAPLFDPFDPGADHPAAAELVRQRTRARGAGSLWVADSPYLLHQLVETLHAVGLAAVVEAYLGERPALSVTKCNVRRVPLDTLYADWHQDGAFLGEGIRTLNVWIALSRCGRDAPGLDLVPKRVALARTGTEGAIFPWAVAPAVVEEVAAGTPVLRPEFDPGDVLLFDELFLHRTACEPGMVRERYAVESWFFAPSRYPVTSIPLVF